MADNDSIRQRALTKEKSLVEKSSYEDSHVYKSDMENQVGSVEPKLKRSLKARHLQMIAIGMLSMYFLEFVH
jgi:amino acid permease